MSVCQISEVTQKFVLGGVGGFQVTSMSKITHVALSWRYGWVLTIFLVE